MENPRTPSGPRAPNAIAVLRAIERGRRDRTGRSPLYQKRTVHRNPITTARKGRSPPRGGPIASGFDPHSPGSTSSTHDRSVKRPSRRFADRRGHRRSGVSSDRTARFDDDRSRRQGGGSIGRTRGAVAVPPIEREMATESIAEPTGHHSGTTRGRIDQDSPLRAACRYEISVIRSWLPSSAAASSGRRATTM
jgi:hypothetical protein